MRSAAKIAWVFLLGLMLAGTSGASFFSSIPPAASCVCPGCARPCCANREAPISQPAAPAPASANPSSLLIAVLAHVLAVPPISRSAVSTASSAAPLAAAAVPLYQRDCTYLI
jgi:hypothetical protein